MLIGQRARRPGPSPRLLRHDEPTGDRPQGGGDGPARRPPIFTMGR